MTEGAEGSNIKRIAVVGVDELTGRAVITTPDGESQPSVLKPLGSIGHVAHTALAGSVEQLGQERPEGPPDMAA